jgi:flavin-binding protein dodecin
MDPMRCLCGHKHGRLERGEVLHFLSLKGKVYANTIARANASFDHVKFLSVGGKTTVDNGQLIHKAVMRNFMRMREPTMIWYENSALSLLVLCVDHSFPLDEAKSL